MYSGKFTPENIAPEGKLAPDQKLSCEIQRIDGHGDLKVKAKRINSLSGIFSGTTSFGGFVKKLSVRYTFLGRIRRLMVLKRKSKLLGQPAVTMEVDNPVEAVVEAPLAGQDASEIVHEEKVWFAVRAGLVAYFRAPINYVRYLFFVRIAKLLSCDGKLARSIRTLTTTRATKMSKGVGVLARSKENTFYTSKEAVADSAPADLKALQHTMAQPIDDAKMDTGGAVDANILTFPTISHKANLASWIYPEIVGDGELILKQAYSAVKNGYELEVN